MSKWAMRAHFRHLRFKSFPMIWRVPQVIEFWPLKLLSEVLRVHRDSISQSGSCLRSVNVHSLTLSYTPGSMWCDSPASSWPATLQCFCIDSRASSWPATLQCFCIDSRASSWPATLQCFCIDSRASFWPATLQCFCLDSRASSCFNSRSSSWPATL
jgi:hypothetical protein